ncbi:hypothetical protein [Anaeromyxobacter oryzae]|uniref:Lipoprotein n=1 Tax=Anaeromyxobacter oryzae TaxID=2918170 RepID=A0ABM7WXV0_9BACT|nr:hypothetical protein [Anaeromyxobacter oryzae]BDG04302.1 hypothetical protein AMOR_32980 [Anaeromyxobacter oryzae]
MKTRLAPILAALSLGAAGCVDNMGSVQIFQTCSIPSDGCTFAATCDAGLLSDVILDVAQQDHLWLVVQVNNQRSKPVNPAVDTAVAYVQEFDTRYDVVAVPAPGTVGTFSAPGTTGRIAVTVPTAGTSTVLIQPITADLGAALVPQVPTSTPTSPKYVDLVARTRLKGMYADQTTFETAEYEIPVHVCKGCLPVVCTSAELALSCPPDAPGQAPSRIDGCVTP